MPDIVVTTPKSRMAEAAREAEELKAAGGGYYIRDYTKGRIPDVRPGDRVYYVEDGYLRGFCLVERVIYASNGKRVARVYMDAETWTWIKPIPWKAPRSFQYAPADLRDKVEIVGGWLDPKPEVEA
jgi:hypothetical protein